MADIFISYSKQTPEYTEDLAADLESAGFTVWWDTRLLPTSDQTFRDVILKELGDAQAAIVIWTPASVKSAWVISEAERARAQGKLIQLRSEDVPLEDIPPPFDNFQINLVQDKLQVYAALLKMDVKPGGVAKARKIPNKTAAEANLQMQIGRWDFIKDKKNLNDLYDFLKQEDINSFLAKNAHSRIEQLKYEDLIKNENFGKFKEFLQEFPNSFFEQELRDKYFSYTRREREMREENLKFWVSFFGVILAIVAVIFIYIFFGGVTLLVI
jgi:hypothetical protein